jgi:Tfp pilus assembly protein PilN
MRPVNLIPSEQRRGRGPSGRPATANVAVYGVLAVLALAVVGVAAYVLTENKVTQKKDEVATLNRDAARAQMAADALRPYGQFADMQQARVETIRGLVTTSFNWERVLRSLARTIPSDAWLVSLKGTVSPDVDVESSGSGGGGGGGGASALRSKSPAPAIELTGCTYSHGDVARMMTRMRNLDGVSEVVLTNSERPQTSSQQPGGGQSQGASSDDCRTKYKITQFEILVVFGELVGSATQGVQGFRTPASLARSAVATANSTSSSLSNYSPEGSGK